jgi:hypothetical protein
MEGATRLGVHHTRGEARLLAATCARWAGGHFHGDFLPDLEFPEISGRGRGAGSAYDDFVLGVHPPIVVRGIRSATGGR